MEVQIAHFWAPKYGNDASEYEDAFQPAEEGPVDLQRFHAAVADGASDSSFSRQWADLLVQGFHRGVLSAASLVDRIPHFRRRWRRRIEARSLPWYAEQKLERGAFSTLLGLTIEDSPEAPGGGGTWSALAIGDSCMAQVRDDQMVTMFPLDRPCQFDNRPYLIATNPQFQSDLAAHILQDQGTWSHGDCFYLMTDALAAWFATSYLARTKPWEFLREFGSCSDSPDFHTWLSSLRSNRDIRNDDVTLLRIDVFESPPARVTVTASNADGSGPVANVD